MTWPVWDWVIAALRMGAHQEMKLPWGAGVSWLCSLGNWIKPLGGMKKISINLKIIHLWPFRHTNKYYKHLDLYQCQAWEGALPASCCLSVSWCTFIQVIFKLGKGKKPCCGRLVALTTSNMHYLQSQLHFLHLHTLILACANVWVFDFCNLSALIMWVCVCMLGGTFILVLETGRCSSKNFC